MLRVFVAKWSSSEVIGAHIPAGHEKAGKMAVCREERKPIESNIDWILINASERHVRDDLLAPSTSKSTRPRMKCCNYKAKLIFSTKNVLSFIYLSVFRQRQSEMNNGQTQASAIFMTPAVVVFVSYFAPGWLHSPFIVLYSVLHAAPENKIENINFSPQTPPSPRSFSPAEKNIVTANSVQRKQNKKL